MSRFAYAESVTDKTANSTTYVDACELGAASLTANTRYLILAFATTRCSGGGHNTRIRLVRGETPTLLTDSYQSYEEAGTTTDQMKRVASWMHVLDVGASAERLRLQIANSSTSTTTCDLAQIIAIKLSDLTENTDYFWAEDTVDKTLTATPVTGASLTFTADGTDQWLILGQGIVQTGTGVEQKEGRLYEDGASILMCNSEGDDSSGNDEHSFFFCKVRTPTAASHTYDLRFVYPTGTETPTLRSTRIFALNLSKFNQASVSQDAAAVLPATQPTWTNLQTLSFTPPVNDSYLVLGYYVYDINENSVYLRTRLQSNPAGGGLASTPNYGDDAPWNSYEAPTDEQCVAFGTVQTFNSGVARPVNWDVSIDSGGTGLNRVKERTLLAFSSTLATSTVNLTAADGNATAGGGDASYSQTGGAAPEPAVGEATGPRVAAPPPVTLIVGNRNLTEIAEALQWSTIDPGGCEAASFMVPDRSLLPAVGEKVLIYLGLECVWEGRVDEPGQNYQGSRTAGRVAAVGAGAALKDDPYAKIYVCRDLSRWRDPSVARQIALASSPRITGSGEVAIAGSASPALRQRHVGTWSQAVQDERYYDAAIAGNISAIYYNFEPNARVSPADTNWSWSISVSSDDVLTNTDSSGNLRAASGSGYFTPATARRYGVLFFSYAAANAGGGQQEYDLMWRNLAVYGDHTLTRRGTDPGGFYPADIAEHARQQATGIDKGPVDTDPNSYVVYHAAYYTPVMPEQVIDDMIAKHLGWHWGVWPAPGLQGGVSNPRLHIRKPPTSATAWVQRSKCEDIDLSERLSDMHSGAEVLYTDAAGTAYLETVSRRNPRLPSKLSRVTPLEIGMSTSAAAQTYGDAILALQEQQARAAGQVVLPETVGGAAGRKPAALLKAGLDRLRIVDLPQAGPMHEGDSRRFDTFRLRRVETSVSPQGTLRTSVEVDAGANLIEVMAARMEVAAVAFGAGR